MGLSDLVLHRVALRSAEIALTVTAITFILAMCLAYVAVMHVKRKNLFVFAVVLPLWVSYIVRAFAWRLVLGDHGVLNSALMSSGITSSPVHALIFSKIAVVTLLVHEYMAFMFIPLYSVLDGLDKNVLLAAQDLYASPLKRFMRVTFPLSAPGIAVGVMFVFPLSFGDYIAPDLVGGPNSTMIGSLVAQQFGVNFNWPYGATIALGILTLILLVVWLMERWSKSEEIRLI
jgi:spermidine/putrescine transport system permease protein